ncbi:MAG TPA: ornithine carbamoyltransferase [Deltaproteobacteria bacterium]|nr:ornithine carbamoyltransferase [Deltaproteobacteria bacterium]HHZ79381.1 ornithine carbamoyltransferase [Candidatus Lambdaproteobacteria bacterium]HIA56736.1 ornithine carbamoyltransferase [Candidatus Lambdaproteobacteria bacterium]HIN46921.1 ornithine carbamoyltransferase [Deltaproteobacteria bacterium]HIO60747.1 ornithine carbamoyltransferase [Deltaproteobacteria bacterium]
MKRDFISILDWTTEEIHNNLDFAVELKQQTKEGMCPQLLERKTYVLFFHKPSLRTRLSFEVGIAQLGGTSMVLSEQDFKIGERETVSDVARVMSRYVDGILIRTFSHQLVLDLAKHATVPIVNMLTDFNHPCQVMSDLLTIKEKLGHIDNVRIAYVGDSNNMTNSWLNLAARIPLDLRIATAPETLPDMKLVSEIREIGISTIKVTHSAQEAVDGAEVLYTDVWASMGEKDKLAERELVLKEFQINSSLLKYAEKDALVLHCLPAERGKEITDEVIESTQSVVFDQAENRLHAQKAILVQLEKWRTV